MPITKTHGFIISRLQGFHKGHRSLILNALKYSNTLTVLIGSSNKAGSLKNPFTYKERVKMAKMGLPAGIPVTFELLPDFDYNDDLWEEYLHNTIGMLTKEGHTPTIFTSQKGEDDLLRKEWARDIEVISFPVHKQISATDVRKALLASDMGYLNENVPNPSILVPLMKECSKPMYEKHMAVLRNQYTWKDSPYPVISSCTDAVILDRERHVLLVRRGKHPGKGLWALPGGHLEPNLTEAQNVYKEVLEETGLEINDTHYVKDDRFDAVDRSEAGRIVTTAFAFQVNSLLPEVTGGDDAAEARWFTIAELRHLKMYDDHYGIIVSMIREFEVD